MAIRLFCTVATVLMCYLFAWSPFLLLVHGWAHIAATMVGGVA